MLQQPKRRLWYLSNTKTKSGDLKPWRIPPLHVETPTLHTSHTRQRLKDYIESRLGADVEGRLTAVQTENHDALAAANTQTET